MSRSLEDEIEIISMCMPIREHGGGMWFGRNNNYADATFVDWGTCRAFARAARELPRLLAAIRDIERIVHVPTSKTPHKSAQDHFQADFDAIRKICAPFAPQKNTSGVE